MSEQAMILVIDDEPRHRELYSGALSGAGFRVQTASCAREAADIIRASLPDMIISDVKMPGMDGIAFLREIRKTLPALPFLMVTAFGDVKDAVEALKLGAVDYLEKPIDLDELLCAVNDSLKIGHKTRFAELECIPKDLLDGIVCESPAMRSVIVNAWKVAQSDATVLLTGESGTGKEVVASFIHRSGRRHSAPMVALNCAAIPANILASELFGHRKGAFTGAIADREGMFLAAHKGTLFLDEIGDMPLDLQPALLRAIEAGCISPVGSDRETKVDLRLIAATNCNLSESVANGRFRRDLYYRLNVIALELPPLRDRPEDALPLAHLFLSTRSPRPKRFSQAASRLLHDYPWPGNVRELANAIERAAIISNTDIILPEHLPPAVANFKPSGVPAPSSGTNELSTISQMEVDAIGKTLRQVGGNRTKAAKILGISRRALIYKIKRFDIQE